jgi:hypothetical protein
MKYKLGTHVILVNNGTGDLARNNRDRLTVKLDRANPVICQIQSLHRLLWFSLKLRGKPDVWLQLYVLKIEQ